MKINTDKLIKCKSYFFYYFLILNIGLEIAYILKDKNDFFKLNSSEVALIMEEIYRFGFKYFENEKVRISIEDKVLLGEIERTLESCVDIIVEDKLNNREEMDYKYEKSKYLLVYLIESEVANIVYWNNPAHSHLKQKSSKFSKAKTGELLNMAFGISNSLVVNLIERFQWIKIIQKDFYKEACSLIQKNKKRFCKDSLAFDYLVDFVVTNGLDDLKDINNYRKFLTWKEVSLTTALRFLSIPYSGMECLQKFAISVLEKGSDKAISFFVPEIIQTLRTKTNNLVRQFVLRICKRSPMLAHQFLWALEVEEVSLFIKSGS